MKSVTQILTPENVSITLDIESFRVLSCNLAFVSSDAFDQTEGPEYGWNLLGDDDQGDPDFELPTLRVLGQSGYDTRPLTVNGATEDCPVSLEMLHEFYPSQIADLRTLESDLQIALQTTRKSLVVLENSGLKVRVGVSVECTLYGLHVLMKQPGAKHGEVYRQMLAAK